MDQSANKQKIIVMESEVENAQNAAGISISNLFFNRTSAFIEKKERTHEHNKNIQMTIWLNQTQHR